MKTMAEYELIAKKIIAKHPMRTTILQSEEKFSDIMMAVMTADWKWDGRGNIYGYRKAWVGYAIKNLLTKHKRENKKNTISIFLETGDNLCIEDSIEDEYNDIKQIEDQDYLDAIFQYVEDSTEFDQKKKTAFLRYSRESMSVKDIAIDQNSSTTTIRNYINIVKEKINTIFTEV